jgi:uncharacterized protein (DUF983 family)
MRPTPLRNLLARSLRGHCPICGRGPLFHGVLTLRPHCPDCGYRYRRAVEYGGEGFLSGAVSINILLTGTVLAAWLIYLAATGRAVPLATQFAVGLAWSVVFPVLFHRAAVGLWVAIDLRLNPPAEHELAAAPPRDRG